MKQKYFSSFVGIRSILVISFVLLGLIVGSLSIPATVSAAPESGGGGGGTVGAGENKNKIAQADDPALTCSSDSTDTDTSCNLYKKYINPIIVFLSALVGVAVTIGIISGGIKYAMAGSEPGQLAAARKQIRNSLIALLAFLFLYAALNWLTPGGII